MSQNTATFQIVKLPVCVVDDVVIVVYVVIKVKAGVRLRCRHIVNNLHY